VSVGRQRLCLLVRCVGCAADPSAARADIEPRSLK
jgi:hypothetical protein